MTNPNRPPRSTTFNPNAELIRPDQRRRRPVPEPFEAQLDRHGDLIMSADGMGFVVKQSDLPQLAQLLAGRRVGPWRLDTLPPIRCVWSNCGEQLTLQRGHETFILRPEDIERVQDSLTGPGRAGGVVAWGDRSKLGQCGRCGVTTNVETCPLCDSPVIFRMTMPEPMAPWPQHRSRDGVAGHTVADLDCIDDHEFGAPAIMVPVGSSHMFPVDRRGRLPHADEFDPNDYVVRSGPMYPRPGPVSRDPLGDETVVTLHTGIFGGPRMGEDLHLYAQESLDDTVDVDLFAGFPEREVTRSLRSQKPPIGCHCMKNDYCGVLGPNDHFAGCHLATKATAAGMVRQRVAVDPGVVDPTFRGFVDTAETMAPFVDDPDPAHGSLSYIDRMVDAIMVEVENVEHLHELEAEIAAMQGVEAEADETMSGSDLLEQLEDLDDAEPDLGAPPDLRKAITEVIAAHLAQLSCLPMQFDDGTIVTVDGIEGGPLPPRTLTLRIDRSQCQPPQPSTRQTYRTRGAQSRVDE